MGTRYGFTCEQCGYETIVSGGKDWGFSCATETMVCHGCNELVDVLIEVRGHTASDIDYGRCPKCRGQNVTPWTKPGPCPKCGGRMLLGHSLVSVMNWD